MAFRKIVAEHLAEPGARYRAQVRVSRYGCSYPAAYRAEGLCGFCGRIPVEAPGFSCDACKTKRRNREKSTRDAALSREKKAMSRMRRGLVFAH